MPLDVVRPSKAPSIFDGPLRAMVSVDQQSCSKTNQNLVRVHLQWDCKSQLGSHAVGHIGENVGECKKTESVSRGVAGSSTALVFVRTLC